MHVIALAVAPDHEAQAAKAPRVERLTPGVERERHLDEAAVIVEPNAAAQPQAAPPRDDLEGHLLLRDPAHHLVGEAAPQGPGRRASIVAAEVVDQQCCRVRHLFLA
jgi:hypothetical protein